ncbi:MAG TPA: TIGR02594 family protein [Caulifigura sp.]|jgi:uncharacterized protein (TIGR02594 family)|nr:TIGR02594 family protein [Caulifigura sp.]
MSRWNAVWRGLPPAEKKSISELVNGIFKEQTGFGDKIDPKTHPERAAQWMAIRDSVLSDREKFAAFLNKTIIGLQDIARATVIYRMFSRVPTWIEVARAQIGQQEIAGSTHNPRIMEYIWTCTNIQETDNQKKYVTRTGEEGVEWCSAYVNWCLKQVGIDGTNHALASSWLKWGTKLDEPKVGAIVGFNWSGGTNIHHVAFCDRVDNEWRCLGGNQSDPRSGGIVSSVPLNRGAIRYMRWPDEPKPA